MTLATGCNRRARGVAAFTLVEITIVVFIMATMLALAVPSFVRSFQTSQLNNAARSLVTLSQLARLQAALQQRPAELHLDLENQAIWVAQELVRDDEWPTSGASAIHKRIELSSAVRMVTVQLTDDTPSERGAAVVRYYPNGSCDGATLWLQGKDAREVIEVRIDPVTARAAPHEVKR